MDGHYAEGAAGLAGDHAAAEMDGVAAELAVYEGVGPLGADVGYIQQLARLADESGAHLDGGGAGLGVDAATVGDADHQVEVAHGLAEKEGRYLFEGQGLPLAAPGELHALDGKAVDVGGGVEAFEE